MNQPQDIPGNEIFCPKCGQKNLENNFKCTQCGFVLHGNPAPQVIASDGTLGGLIPYKNARALAAYYCGVFSLIPCFGFPLGVVAVVFGILGLKFAKKYPGTKGAVHAWVGIVLGGLVVVATLAAIMLIIFFRARRR